MCARTAPIVAAGLTLTSCGNICTSATEALCSPCSPSASLVIYTSSVASPAFASNAAYWVTGSYYGPAGWQMIRSVNITGSGNFIVNSGDQIYVSMNGTACYGTSSIACSIISGSVSGSFCSPTGASLSSSIYTVQPSDIGNNLYINTFVSCNPTPTTTLAPTTTAAPVEVYSGCGYGNSVAAACTDASVYSRTLYSNCNAGVFGVGCIVYVNAGGTVPLTGYTNVFINSASWDINSSTGVITAYSSTQC
jgi:hypothetical protein